MKNLKDIVNEGFLIKKHQKDKDYYNIGKLKPSEDKIKNNIISIIYDYINNINMYTCVDEIISEEHIDPNYLIYKIKATNPHYLLHKKNMCHIIHKLNTGGNPIWFIYNKDNKEAKYSIYNNLPHNQWTIIYGMHRNSSIIEKHLLKVLDISTSEFKNFKI